VTGVQTCALPIFQTVLAAQVAPVAQATLQKKNLPAPQVHQLAPQKVQNKC